MNIVNTQALFLYVQAPFVLKGITHALVIL